MPGDLKSKVEKFIHRVKAPSSAGEKEGNRRKLGQLGLAYSVGTVDVPARVVVLCACQL